MNNVSIYLLNYLMLLTNVNKRYIINAQNKKEEEYYSSMRYDEEENEFLIKEELKEYCEKNNMKYELTIDYGFDSPGYENEFLALAYLDENNTLQLETVVLECF